MRKPPNLTSGRTVFPVNFKTTAIPLTLQTNLGDNAGSFSTELEARETGIDIQLDLNEESTLVQAEINTDSQRLDIQADVQNDSEFFVTDIKNVYYITKDQSDWSQTDETAPDYIKNKEIAEELRPVIVNGVEVLGKERASGPIEFISGDNITLDTDGNRIIISSSGSFMPERGEKEFLSWLLENLPLGTGLKVFDNPQVEEIEKELDVNEDIEFIWDANE